MNFQCLEISQKANKIQPRFLSYEARAEILVEFGWLFGRFEDNKISFWDYWPLLHELYFDLSFRLRCYFTKVQVFFQRDKPPQLRAPKEKDLRILSDQNFLKNSLTILIPILTIIKKGLKVSIIQVCFKTRWLYWQFRWR